MLWNSAGIPAPTRQQYFGVESRAVRKGLERRRSVSESYEARIREAAEQIVAREVADLRARMDAAKGTRSGERFRALLDGYYFDEPPAFVGERMRPPLSSLIETIAGLAAAEVDAAASPETIRETIEAYLARFTVKHLIRSRRQVYGMVKEHGDDFAEPLDERLEEWEERRPGKVALEERVEAASAAAKAVWVAAGFNGLRWVLLGDSCPICQSLRDTVIPADQPFVGPGDEVPSHWGGEGFRPGGPVYYPPVHAGCDCSILPTRL